MLVVDEASPEIGGWLCLRWRLSLRLAFWLCLMLSLGVCGVSLLGEIFVRLGDLQDGILR